MTTTDLVAEIAKALIWAVAGAAFAVCAISMRRERAAAKEDDAQVEAEFAPTLAATRKHMAAHDRKVALDDTRPIPIRGDQNLAAWPVNAGRHAAAVGIATVRSTIGRLQPLPDNDNLAAFLRRVKDDCLAAIAATGTHAASSGYVPRSSGAGWNDPEGDTRPLHGGGR